MKKVNFIVKIMMLQLKTTFSYQISYENICNRFQILCEIIRKKFY